MIRDCDDYNLIEKQKLPLKQKIKMTNERIIDWYSHWEGQVYISFSGGKDSTVLFHLIKNLYPDVPTVFINTGFEYPEIIKFVRSFENIIWLNPKIKFINVIKKYGYPIISKEQSQYLQQYRHAKSEKTKNTRLNGNSYGRGKISEKWKYLIDAPFEISDKCCTILKKNPAINYEKETNRKPYIGILAEESSKRVQNYNLYGCNAFNAKRPTSKPLSFWLENDIWKYIKKENITCSEIYKKGYTRTGCAGCMYGLHLNNPNKIEQLKISHPKMYDYLFKNLNYKTVIDHYLKIK